MKNRAFVFSALLALCLSQQSVAQIPRVISYQGILRTEGKPFSGNALLIFKLLRGIQIGWTSSPMTVHVDNGLFGVMLGPFPNEFTFDGIDSLSITLDGSELSPRVALSASPFSISSFHSIMADSARNPGPPGSPGLKGDKGDAGVLGVAGTKGDKGDAGVLGATGAKGDKGDIGVLGVAGAKGDKGDAGVLGAAGAKGDKGDIGVLGVAGAKGDKGDAGVLGVAGAKGDKGDAGVLGVAGAKGDKGDAGVLGVAGAKGDKGDVGLVGANGTTGLKGDAGMAGVTGATGLKGDQGSKGDPGSQGFKGDKGDPNTLSSTNGADGVIVFSINQAALVRTGDAGTLRLQNLTDPALNVTYSAFWHTVNAVGTSNGPVGNGSSVVFSVAGACQFSIMVKVGNQWGKVDLFRGALTDIDWYGSWTSN